MSAHLSSEGCPHITCPVTFIVSLENMSAEAIILQSNAKVMRHKLHIISERVGGMVFLYDYEFHMK